MVLVFLLSAAALAVFGALLKKSVRFALSFSRTGYALKIELLGIRFTREGAYDRLFSAIMKGAGKKSVLRPDAGDVIDCIEPEALRVRARMGINGDAAATAFVCGALRALLDACAAALCEKVKLCFDVRPEFSRGMLWIYMEGILAVYPGKLILKTIGKLMREVMRKWLIRSRTSWRPPWRSSGKWSM